MSDLFSDIDLFEGTEVFIPDADTADYGPESALPVHISVDHYPAKLPLEIALCQSYDDQLAVAEKFCLLPAELDRILALPQFRQALAEADKTVRESGYGFKVKCRAIAEDFLADLDYHLHSSDVGLSTKLDIFKTMTRLGELEPAPKKGSSADQTGPTVNIQINI